jgi:hypothetical protein
MLQAYTAIVFLHTTICPFFKLSLEAVKDGESLLCRLQAELQPLALNLRTEIAFDPF